MNGNFKDLRLIEAFDYIDPKYIAEVGESLKLRSVAEPQSATYTKPSPFKYWKQYAALVACVLLLSMAFPVFGYVIEVINSFAAAGTTEGTNDETTNDMYDEYILTAADLAELNEAEFKYLYEEYPAGWFSDEELQELKNSKYGKFAETVEAAMSRSTHQNSTFYFGKYGDSIVIAHNGMLDMGYPEYEFGYRFYYRNTMMLVCHDSTYYYMSQACEMGLLTESDVKMLHDTYLEYYSDIPAELKVTNNDSPVRLSEDELREIVWLYIKYDDDKDKLDHTYNVRCYGRFNDKFALMIDSSAVTYEGTTRTETVDGVDFVFDSNQKMYIYRWGRLDSLYEAFHHTGFIDRDDLLTIKENMQ